MKNTFYDKINHKKAVWIIIRNGHSKQLCDNVRDDKKMGNCPSIYYNAYGLGYDSRLNITSKQKQVLKKFCKKKIRQNSKKICNADY